MHGMVVVVAEDHAVLRRTVVRMLERAGFKPCGVENGAQALRRCRQGAVPLVITDLGMPQMDGHALIAALRREMPEVRVVAMSGEAKALARAQAAGADRVLAKPFEPRDLIGLVESALAPG